MKGPAIVPRPPQGQVVVFGHPGLVPAEQLDVALVTGRDVAAVATAAAGAGTPRVLAEIEVALDTAHATAEERVADLEHHAPWADRGRLRYVGSAAGLAALLERLRGVVDGVRLHPLVMDEDLAELSRLVLPHLFERRHAAPSDARRFPAHPPRPGPARQPLRHGGGPGRGGDPMTRTDPHDVPRPDAQLHLGVFFQGVNSGPSGDPAERLARPTSSRSAQVAQTAERGLFAAFFLGEGLRLREHHGRRTTSTSPAGPTRRPSWPPWPP